MPLGATSPSLVVEEKSEKPYARESARAAGRTPRRVQIIEERVTNPSVCRSEAGGTGTGTNRLLELPQSA